MTIFFLASVRGGRGQQPRYEAIVRELGSYGTVLSSHVANEELSRFGETDMANGTIRERELAALAKADIVVAEVTTPSLGVGYLIARATSTGKRVVALYRGKDTLRLSAIIAGDPHVEIHTYENDEDAENILMALFSGATSEPGAGSTK